MGAGAWLPNFSTAACKTNETGCASWYLEWLGAAVKLSWRLITHFWAEACRSTWLRRMRGLSLTPGGTFSAAISACDKARQWPAALALLREAIQRSVAQGYCYNAAISACEKGGQWITALELFREMRAADLEVDAFSFAAAASACEKGAAWPASLQLHQLLFQVGVQPNVVSFGTALAAAAAAPWPTALELLSEMRHCRVTPNIISYNAVVHACEQGASGRIALDLVQEARDLQLRIDGKFLGVALAACRRGGFWEEAILLWSSLAKQEPNDHHLASCLFAIQACEGTAAGVALCAELGKRLQRAAGPRAAELDQAFGCADELLERGQLTAAAATSLGRRAAGARGRLLALAGIRRQPTSQLAPAASPRAERGSWRLHEPLLELQPSLGWVYTTEVLQGQLAFSSSGRWRGSARRASRRELSDALLNEDLDVSSQSIISWLAFNMQADTSGLSMGVPGRCTAFAASWTTDSVQGGLALEQRLLPVFREHDRSQHAERMALLSVATSAASQNQERAADRQSTTFGAVRLYATHTLCISCLAVCCQFHRLFPRVSLKVEMDTWDETLRWSCQKASSAVRAT
ncbi:unnamed protein product [Symbiodinium sp. CCMP2592]|nr:unnamed protein product [Symbiodinium sp. CCMP2592]